MESAGMGVPKIGSTKHDARKWLFSLQQDATSRTLDRDGKLFSLLLIQKKYDEARKAADAEYQMKLFETYGI